MTKAILLVLPVAAALHAQAVKEYEFHLDNGATVLYQSFAETTAKDPAPNLGTARAEGNTIIRNITDSGNARQLGFNLRVEKLAGDPVRFRVSMDPLLKPQEWGYFSRAAAPREIQNGDRVLMDVLQDTQTGRKVSDSFAIGIGIGMEQMPTTKSAPRTAPAGTQIHLDIAGKTGNGPALTLIFPLHVFTLSTQAEPGSRMEAVAEGNELKFVWRDGRYDIHSSVPVIDGQGAWYLWVRHDTPGRAPANVPALDLTHDPNAGSQH